MTTLKNIPLNSMNCDLLRLAEPDQDAKLARSLREHGQLVPLSVFSCGGELYLADGFKRAAALEKFGTPEASCLLREVKNREDLFRLSLSLRFTGKELTAVQKAILRDKLTESGLRTAKIFKAAGIPDREPEQSILTFLTALPGELRNRLHSTGISLKQLRNIERLGTTLSLRLLQEAAAPLKLNANQIRKALELAADIKIAGGDPDPLLEAPESDENPAAAARLFFEKLEEARRPDFTAAEKEFNSMKKNFPGFRLDHRNFDDACFDFTFSAGSAAEVEVAVQTLRENGPALKKLFSLHGPGTR